MGNTRVKICGVTRPEDARAAALAGADAIGLVFHPSSPRAVDIETARSVVHALPPFVTAVALFLDPDAERVRTVLESVPVGLLQFHGSEPADFCVAFERPYFKVVGMAGDGDPDATARAHPAALAVMVDGHATGQSGGSGRTFAWDRLPTARDYRLILAGGLSPDNVADAVDRVRPDAVDVSSGVESDPGIKDPALIEQFIEEVRRGDRAQA